MSDNKITCKAGSVVATFAAPGDQERARWAALTATEAFAFRMGTPATATLCDEGGIDHGNVSDIKICTDVGTVGVDQVLGWIEEAILIPPTERGTVALAKDARATIMALSAEIARLTAELARVTECYSESHAAVGQLTRDIDAGREIDRQNVAEVNRLTAELAAAGAVTVDVCRYLDCSESDLLAVVTSLYESRARAISDATDKRDAEWQRRIAPLHPNRTGDGCDSGDPIDWTFAALMLARIDVESDAHDEGHRAAMRDATAARGTVGGLLATRCCSKCRGISSHTPGGIPCDECGLVGSMPWGG